MQELHILFYVLQVYNELWKYKSEQYNGEFKNRRCICFAYFVNLRGYFLFSYAYL